MDIKRLIKRLIFLEYCVSHCFSDEQLCGLRVNRPSSQPQIRLSREIFDDIEDEVEEDKKMSCSNYRDKITIEDSYTIEKTSANLQGKGIN